MSDPKRSDPFNEMFSLWEKNTSMFFDQLFRSPNFLEQMGASLEAWLIWRQQVDESFQRMIESMQVSTRSDYQTVTQELDRLQAEVQRLTSHVAVLSQQLAEMNALENSASPAQTAPAVNEPSSSIVVVAPESPAGPAEIVLPDGVAPAAKKPASKSKKAASTSKAKSPRATPPAAPASSTPSDPAEGVEAP